MSKFQDIRKLLQINELKTALDLMVQLVQELGYNNYISDVILMTSSYHGNEGAILRPDDYARNRKKITHQAINFLIRVEEELQDDFHQEFIFEKSKYNSYEDFENRYLDKLEVPKPVDKEKTIFKKTGKEKILFLAANPESTVRLELGKEYRLLSQRMSDNKFYELLPPQLDLTSENFIIAMDAKPQIMHFAGHGSRKAIIVSDDEKDEVEISIEALSYLLEDHKDTLKLILLNACHSAMNARKLSELGFYVIGMNNIATDNGAIIFASGLYIGLSKGKSVEKAFKTAKTLILMKNPSFVSLIEIWKNGEKLNL